MVLPFHLKQIMFFYIQDLLYSLPRGSKSVILPHPLLMWLLFGCINGKQHTLQKLPLFRQDAFWAPSSSSPVYDPHTFDSSCRSRHPTSPVPPHLTFPPFFKHSSSPQGSAFSPTPPLHNERESMVAEEELIAQPYSVCSRGVEREANIYLNLDLRGFSEFLFHTFVHVSLMTGGTPWIERSCLRRNRRSM